MQAWLIDNLTAGVAHAHRAEVPDPAPAPGEVLVDLRYAALNPADAYLAVGQYPARPPTPHVLGRDGMGTVAAIGQGVRDLKPGQKVLLLRGEAGVTRWGTFAQRVAVPVESVVPLPAGWTDEQAAGAALVYLTAYQALTQWHDPPLPDRPLILITGATGGVGIAAIHLAKALAATVIALTRSDEKAAHLRELGADLVYNITAPTWPKQLRDHLDAHLSGRRVDLAVDNIGGPLFSDVISTLGMHGRVSIVGRLAGPVPNFNTSTLLFRRLKLGGVAVGTYTPQESRDAWNQIVSFLTRTNARPVIDQIFPFDQLPAAFTRLAQGPLGKVLLEIA